MQSVSFFLIFFFISFPPAPHPYIVFSFGLRGYNINEAVETKKLNGLALCELWRLEFKS